MLLTFLLFGMKIINILIIFNSIMFLMANTPFLMIMMMIIQTFSICMGLKFMIKTSWFSLILFLIFVGGLLILFIYITSLASNELISWNLNTPILFLMSVLTILLMLSFKWNFFFMKSDCVNICSLIYKMYTSTSPFMTLTLISYLLLTLIITVAIIFLNAGPLRKTLHPMK